MNLLCIGDVVGNAGLTLLSRCLRTLQREHAVDFTIVNGENAAGVGMTPQQGEQLFDAGADVVTLGNHVWKKRQIIPYLEDCTAVLRPANLAPQLPGNGFGIYDTPCGRLLVLNLIGRLDMPIGAENPFLQAEQLLQRHAGEYDLAVCEIHANATSEKIALGYHLDGRVSAVWGTHTHVQTADECIHPQGTGFITDLGMTGPAASVLGVEIAQSVAMFRGDLTEYFREAKGPSVLCGALFSIDNTTKKCTHITRIMEKSDR